MDRSTKLFSQPIYVSRPLMPNLEYVKEKLKDVWESQWLSNGGKQHNKLEIAIGQYLKAPNLSLFNNGTIALLVAIQSLRLQGEVITTPFTFPATTHVLAWNNITPVFSDIDPNTMTIDPEQIESLITSRTSAILGVHVYGIPCHVEKIQSIADRHGLHVVYDAAHAFGSEISGLPIGTFGDISMFSFHPTKLFHTAEGGALIFNDPHLKPRIELLKNFGIKNEFEVIMPGINGKMNEIQAVIGQLVLDMVKNEKEKRAKIRRMYHARLDNISGLKIVTVPDNVINSEQYFVIRINSENFGTSRDKLFDYLRNHNIFARKYFYPLTCDYPCYKQLPTATHNTLSNAVLASSEVLCLPFYGDLTSVDINKICDLIVTYSK